MLNYQGIHCPVCGRAFGADDDIVVCPQCGAPYHRECYAQVGECIFGDLHEKGEDWAPPAPPEGPKAETSAEIKDRECPVCGTLNGHSAMFCTRCGASLLGRSGPQDRPGTADDDEETPPVQPGFIPGMPFAFGGDPMGGVSPAETVEEGVCYGDVSKLVRVNTAYYMPVFRNLKKEKRNKFNFAAFLFSGGWFLYRRQYKLGAILTGIMLALYALFLSLYLMVAVPALKELAGQQGIDLAAAETLSAQETLELSQAMADDPGLMAKISGFLIIPPIMLGVMLFCGFRGNKLYLDHCVKTVKEIARQDEDPEAVMSQRGGVSSLAALGAAMGLIVIRMALLMMLGYGLF